jgi:hypothetical protein
MRRLGPPEPEKLDPPPYFLHTERRPLGVHVLAEVGDCPPVRSRSTCFSAAVPAPRCDSGGEVEHRLEPVGAYEVADACRTARVTPDRVRLALAGRVSRAGEGEASRRSVGRRSEEGTSRLGLRKELCRSSSFPGPAAAERQARTFLAPPRPAIGGAVDAFKSPRRRAARRSTSSPVRSTRPEANRES